MNFNDWLASITQNNVPANSIIAYNFGLFQTEEGYTAYLTGATEFDPDNDDWATIEDFTPAEKYFALPAEFKDKDWEAIQDIIVAYIEDFLSSEPGMKSFFSKAQAITTGFDDGDLVRIK